MNTTLKAHLALLSVSLIYGGNYIIAKEVMNNDFLKPLGFILLRVIAGFILFNFFHIFFIKEKLDRKDLPRVALCALFGVALNQMFFFMGLERTTPINASLIMTCTPILVLLASSILIKEHITLVKIIGIVLGGIGAILLIGNGRTVSFQEEGLIGDLMIIINALVFGIFLVIGKELMQKYNAITVTKWMFTIGIFYVLPFGIGPLSETNWSDFTPGAWIGVTYVLIGTTFLAYLFNTYALKRVSPAIVSVYIYLQPFFATTLALILGMDTLSFVKLIAGILIFIGVYLISRAKTA